MTDNHHKYINIALSLARRGIGRTGPNPSVGCLIVQDGQIIARSRTADSGRPHAETEALKIAGKNTKDSIVYVTLEPCSHRGKTPPCAAALIKAKVKTVVIATEDPNPKVNGKGISMLKAAGIKVFLGVGEEQALEINKAFFKRIKTGLPYVTVKFATSEDGKYLEGDGKPKWVTSEVARTYAHVIRAQNDAIITGTGTVIADNPRLNARLPGLEKFSPTPIVIGKTKIPKKANLSKASKYTDIKNALNALAKEGINSVLVEAGPALTESFLGYADEVIHITSNYNLKQKGKAFLRKPLPNHFIKSESRNIGEDLITVYCKN